MFYSLGYRYLSVRIYIISYERFSSFSVMPVVLFNSGYSWTMETDITMEAAPRSWTQCRSCEFKNESDWRKFRQTVWYLCFRNILKSKSYLLCIKYSIRLSYFFSRRPKSLFLETQERETFQVKLLESFFQGANCYFSSKFCMLHGRFYMS